ncbi:MAG: general secretion pathway protein GspC [Deltaproteobacteria bacterium]|nr:general secretion pathway protein GspC [Deltaproteobacteria bacterium]
MGLDAKLKRFFPLIVCALAALAAYLQASGIGELVGTSVSDSAPVASPTAAHAAEPGKGRARRSADPILARNPFDSVTGPLTEKPEEAPKIAPEAAPAGNPLDDPSCELGGRVLLISASDDPEWSFAAFEGEGGKPILRRRGDEVRGHVVQYLAWDRVWMTKDASRCQLKVGEVAKPGAAAARPVSSPIDDPGRRRFGRQIPPELAAKIHKVSDTEFNVERSVVDEILENQAQLMRTARIVPEKEGDKVVGIRLFGIRDETLLGTLGFQNGDRLQSINGFEITDPQKALEAYGRLRTADHLTVSVVRKGKPMNIDFNIQ